MCKNTKLAVMMFTCVKLILCTKIFVWGKGSAGRGWGSCQVVARPPCGVRVQLYFSRHHPIHPHSGSHKTNYVLCESVKNV